MGAAAGAAAAAVMQAMKASGIFVQMEPREFQQVLYKADKPLLVVNEVGLFKKKYQYLLSYRGFILATKSETKIHLPSGSEVIEAAKVWLPG